jgi:hypothetical protein
VSDTDVQRVSHCGLRVSGSSRVREGITEPLTFLAVWAGLLCAVERLAQDGAGLRDRGTRRMRAAERIEHHEVVRDAARFESGRRLPGVEASQAADRSVRELKNGCW